MRIMKDGHIHTPFCPHGSSDSFHFYIEKAMKENVSTITFTEHAPLPAGFKDPVPNQDSAMPLLELESYLKEIESLKAEYKNDISILAGLEVDYITGFEKETKQFLDDVGPVLDDSILSVHFLQINGAYYCLDYSPSVFRDIVRETGSLEQTIDLYFQTVLASIESDLGMYKPNRIGHITLVRKFHQHYKNVSVKEKALPLLDAMQEKGMELDYNGAGTNKPLCGEPYPANEIVKEAKKRGIPLVYGSDAHQAKDMMQGLKQMIPVK